MSDIKPALTVEEWAANLAGRGDEHSVDGEVYMSEAGEDEGKLLFVGYDAATGIELERPHKAAALALYGQPFGFTWEDVDRHRFRAELLSVDLNWTAEPDDQKAQRRDDIAWHTSMADRITALLPPRG